MQIKWYIENKVFNSKTFIFYLIEYLYVSRPQEMKWMLVFNGTLVSPGTYRCQRLFRWMTWDDNEKRISTYVSSQRWLPRRGFEPATFRSLVRLSNRLRHHNCTQGQEIDLKLVVEMVTQLVCSCMPVDTEATCMVCEADTSDHHDHKSSTLCITTITSQVLYASPWSRVKNSMHHHDHKSSTLCITMIMSQVLVHHHDHESSTLCITMITSQVLYASPWSRVQYSMHQHDHESSTLCITMIKNSMLVYLYIK